MSTEPLDKTEKLNQNWWYLYGEAYDFSNFVKSHPGGTEAIGLGRGRDCTALFESYHTRLPSTDLLLKYKIDKNDDKYKNSSSVTDISNFTFTYSSSGFYRTVKKRALNYFMSSGYSNTKGGFLEILGWLLNVFIFLICCYYSNVVIVRGSSLFAIIYGIFKSLMVIRSTHAASHFSFSKYPLLNKFVYWLNMSLLGDTPKQWTAKHVIAHHIDTNVIPIDDDTMYPIKRVLSSYERYWYHRYQHIYIWLLYSFVYYPWTISHNIKFIYGTLFNKDRLVKEGVIDIRCCSTLDYVESISAILIYHWLRLLPFIYLPTWTHSIIIMLLVEFSSSIWFSLQFAVNHETMEAVLLSGNANDLYGKNNNNVRDFGMHQLVTSHNYSVGYWPTLHLSGGLNYQIEHHLFPSVHYKHYPELGKIVQKTAKEFNLPYNQSDTFFIGISKHYDLLKTMGSKDTI